MNNLSEEEKKAIEYFKEKIKNKLPLYEETYIDGKPYRRNIIQLETNFTEEQAHKTKVLLNLIESQQKEIEELKDTRSIFNMGRRSYKNEIEYKIREKIEELEKEQEDNRKTLYNATNNLYFEKIDKISDRISVNMSVRDILQSLLEEE